MSVFLPKARSRFADRKTSNASDCFELHRHCNDVFDSALMPDLTATFLSLSSWKSATLHVHAFFLTARTNAHTIYCTDP
jgi:hypothetical protein